MQSIWGVASRGAAWLTRLTETRGFLPLCALAFLASRLAVLAVGPLQQSSDEAWYLDRALGLAAGQGYQENGVLTAFWPVGWPAALAALFRLTGPSVLAGQLANLLLAAIALMLTAELGGRWFGDRAVGRLAVLLLILLPNQAGYVPLLSTELFYQMLLLAGLALLSRGRLVWAIAAGLVFGIATLTKAQSLVLPGFILLWLLVAARPRLHWRRWLALAAGVHLAMLVVVGPWTWRNWEVLHAFVPVSTNGGWTLLTGNNPQAKGAYTPNTVLAEGISHDPARQVEMDRLARQRAVAWIADNPGRFLTLLPLKFASLWLRDGEAEWAFQSGYAGYARHAAAFRAMRGLNQLLYFAVLALALPGLWRLLRAPPADRGAQAGPAVLTLFTLVSLVFSGQPRFHLALMPIVALYAAWSICRWGRARHAS